MQNNSNLNILLRLPGSGLFPGFPGLGTPPGGGGGGGLSSESQSPEMMGEGGGGGGREGDKDSNEDRDNSRPSSVSSSNSSMKNASFPTMTSMPSNIEAFIRGSGLGDAALPKLPDGSRPFGLVRPFLMDKHLGGGGGLTIPEDLSPPARKPAPPTGLSNGGKEEAASSPSPLAAPVAASSPTAKFSPVPSPTNSAGGKEESDSPPPPPTAAAGAALPPPPPSLALPLPKSEDIPKTPLNPGDLKLAAHLALDLTPRYDGRIKHGFHPRMNQ